MLNVKCQQSRVEESTAKTCNRYLLSSSEGIIAYIRTHPGEKLILRCPNCENSYRWAEIIAENNKLIFRTIDKPPKSDDLIFDVVDIAEVV